MKSLISKKIQKYFCVVKVLKITYTCARNEAAENRLQFRKKNTSVKVDDISLNSILIFLSLLNAFNSTQCSNIRARVQNSC